MLFFAFLVDYPLGGEQMTSSANAVRRSKANSQRDIPGQSNVHRENAYLYVFVCVLVWAVRVGGRGEHGFVIHGRIDKIRHFSSI